jgi:hypothetical protein
MIRQGNSYWNDKIRESIAKGIWMQAYMYNSFITQFLFRGSTDIEEPWPPYI